MSITRAAVFLLALIYGVPWIIMAQLIAEMIFVGLTSWQTFSDSDREWFGRSTGWFGVVAFGWFIVDVSGARRRRVHALARRRTRLGKYASAILAARRVRCSARLLGKSGKTASAADAEVAILD